MYVRRDATSTAMKLRRLPSSDGLVARSTLVQSMPVRSLTLTLNNKNAKDDVVDDKNKINDAATRLQTWWRGAAVAARYRAVSRARRPMRAWLRPNEAVVHVSVVVVESANVMNLPKQTHKPWTRRARIFPRTRSYVAMLVLTTLPRVVLVDAATKFPLAQTSAWTAHACVLAHDRVRVTAPGLDVVLTDVVFPATRWAELVPAQAASKQDAAGLVRVTRANALDSLNFAPTCVPMRVRTPDSARATPWVWGVLVAGGSVVQLLTRDGSALLPGAERASSTREPVKGWMLATSCMSALTTTTSEGPNEDVSTPVVLVLDRNSAAGVDLDSDAPTPTSTTSTRRVKVTTTRFPDAGVEITCQRDEDAAELVDAVRRSAASLDLAFRRRVASSVCGPRPSGGSSSSLTSSMSSSSTADDDAVDDVATRLKITRERLQRRL